METIVITVAGSCLALALGGCTASAAKSDDRAVTQTIVHLGPGGSQQVETRQISRAAALAGAAAPTALAAGAPAQGLGVAAEAITTDTGCTGAPLALFDVNDDEICFIGTGTASLTSLGWSQRTTSYMTGASFGELDGVAGDLYGSEYFSANQPLTPAGMWAQDSYQVVLSSACQTASDELGISSGNPGIAPSTVQSWFTASGCTTSPPAGMCQTVAQEYAITAGVTFGFAPTNVQTWWTANDCDASFNSSTATACAIAANDYAIIAGDTWGYAPSNVQSWWTASDCLVSATGNTCQTAANQYGIVADVTWGFAPANVQTWWTANNCRASAQPWLPYTGNTSVPRVDFANAVVSDVAATLGFETPAGAVVATVTVNLINHVPSGPSDGIVIGADAGAVTAHQIPLNGLVAGTTYRYDVWVGGSSWYTGSLTTASPVTVTTPSAGTHDPVIGPIVNAAVAAYSGPSVGYVVGVRRGAVEDLYYYGTTDLTSGPTLYTGTNIAITGGPPTANTVFCLGSIAKTFTATLVTRYVTDPTLAGAGIHLSDPVMPYLPSMYQAAAGSWQDQITVGELATMTGGLPDLAGYGSLAALFTAFDTAAEAAPLGTPSYSDLGYSVLGRAIESKVGGVTLPAAQPWETLLATEVTGPLGMPSTQPLLGELPNCGGATPCNYLMSPSVAAQLAQLYNCNTSPCTPDALPGPTNASPENPSGGLWSTPADMMQWLSANMGHTSAGWMAAALAMERSGTGVGWGIVHGTTTTIEKGGVEGNALDVYIAYQPELDTGAFILTNSDPGPDSSQQIVTQILANLPASNLVNLP